MDLLGLILTIVQAIATAARTARRNKSRCLELADRVWAITDLLRDSKEANDPATRNLVLGRLKDALAGAHKLVESCSRRSDWLSSLLASGRQAGRFDDVDRKINNCLLDLGICLQMQVAARGHPSTNAKVVSTGKGNKINNDDVKKKKKEDVAMKEKKKDDVAMKEKKKDDGAMKEKKKDDVAMKEKKKDDVAMKEKKKDDVAMKEKKKDDGAMKKKKKKKKKKDDVAMKEKKKDDGAMKKKKKDDVAMKEKKKDDGAMKEKKKDDVAMKKTSTAAAAGHGSKEPSRARREGNNKQMKQRAPGIGADHFYYLQHFGLYSVEEDPNSLCFVM